MREHRLDRSPAWAGGRFRNLVDTRMMVPHQAGRTAVRFLFGGEHREPASPLPVTRPAPFAAPPAEGVRATWLGHSTVLLELGGRRVLTDPVWAERASPSSVVGPRRFLPPPLALAELPPIDLVLISHDHYDHLDRATVRLLGARGLPFIAPLRVGELLVRWGIPPEQITELDWWESTEHAGLRITATPAQHFSGRGPFDRNLRLWASYVLEGAGSRVYFGGDGGYGEHFADIGQRCGPIDLTLLEIGAFDPAWGDIHLGPENAVRAQRDLGGRVLLPIHWGTFNLALHAWYAPPEELLAAAASAGLRVAFPLAGAAFSLDAPLPSEPWWRALMPAVEGVPAHA